MNVSRRIGGTSKIHLLISGVHKDEEAFGGKEADYISLSSKNQIVQEQLTDLTLTVVEELYNLR